MTASRPLLAALALGVAGIVALASCGDDTTTTSDGAPTTASSGASGASTTTGGSSGQDAAMLPTVSGDVTKKPTVEIPKTDPPSDLVVRVITKGDGEPLTAGDTVNAHYVGQLWKDGTVFDSSWDRGQPAQFPVGAGQLIAGWDEGLVGQTYGSRVLLVVPPDKGYGSAGQPQAGITGTDTLVFVVDLVSKVE